MTKGLQERWSASCGFRSRISRKLMLAVITVLSTSVHHSTYHAHAFLVDTARTSPRAHRNREILVGTGTVTKVLRPRRFSKDMGTEALWASSRRSIGSKRAFSTQVFAKPDSINDIETATSDFEPRPLVESGLVGLSWVALWCLALPPTENVFPPGILSPSTTIFWILAGVWNVACATGVMWLPSLFQVPPEDRPSTAIGVGGAGLFYASIPFLLPVDPSTTALADMATWSSIKLVFGAGILGVFAIVKLGIFPWAYQSGRLVTMSTETASWKIQWLALLFWLGVGGGDAHFAKVFCEYLPKCLQ